MIYILVLYFKYDNKLKFIAISISLSEIDP